MIVKEKRKMKKLEKFDIVVAGIGGQGILTVAGVIARAALAEGYDIKASELHGLSMRFGALEAHLRIGKKVYSPLVKKGCADLIIALEPIEALRVTYYSGKNTSYLFDTRPAVPNAAYLEKVNYPKISDILGAMKKISPGGRALAVDASDTAQAAIGTPVAANVFLVGRAAAENLLPVKKESLLNALPQIFSPALLESNKKVFELGFASVKKK